MTIALSSWVRIHTTLTDPNFRSDRPNGLMRADPGLLFYFLERIVDGNGLPPADFRADPRVEYPRLTDVPALDSVGQEFPIAWSYLLSGRGVPLHVFSLWFMSIFTSVTAAGVYFLVLEVSGEVSWACLAVALFAVTEANYRTLGWVLMREDFSVPFFALHLAMLARAARVRNIASMVLCALTLLVALATWHAMGFVVSLEILCLLAWYLRTGENPFDAPGSWIVPVLVALGSLGIPVLVRTGFLLSLPMRLSAALIVAAILAGRGLGRLAAGSAAIATLAVLSLVPALVGGEGPGGDYAHVYELLFAKLRYLGELPRDPNALSFDARAMWQGPFITLGLDVWPRFFGVALWLFVPAAVSAAWAWIRGMGRSAECLLASLAAIGLGGAWLINRLMFVPGMLLPVCGVVYLSRLRRWHHGVLVIAAALLWQGIAFARIHEDYVIRWYQPPAFLLSEYRAVLAALPTLVPENEAVMADPMLSSAVLADTRRPIVLQPKWEEAEARRRLQDFVLTLFHGSPDALRRLLLEKYRCRYLLVDRSTVWGLRYIAGIPADAGTVKRGTAASVFIDTYASVSPLPGYRLLYRSHLPTDRMRLYELLEQADGTGEFSGNTDR
jgi:hypothetical protein